MYFYAYDNGLYFGLDRETPDGKNRNPAVLASPRPASPMSRWKAG